MVTIDNRLNSLEVLVVAEYLKNRGIEHYSLNQGNDCVWASYGVVNEYYIFKAGLLVDVQID
jgi:hypothetical protein